MSEYENNKRQRRFIQCEDTVNTKNRMIIIIIIIIIIREYRFCSGNKHGDQKCTNQTEKEIYKGTWTSPDKKAINQIYYVII